MPNEDKYYGGWFIAFIDAAGCVAILSDYGNYSHRWSRGREERDMRQFLLNCSPDYVADKFGYGVRAEIDGEATREAIRSYIVERRREESIGAEIARQEWELAGGDLDSDVDFSAWMRETSLEDAYEFYRNHRPQLQSFMRQVWPRLRDCLTADLESEIKARSEAP